MKIGNRSIGYGQPTFVIAEACSNITRYLDNLKEFIETVVKTGADACKVQLFLPSHFPEAEQSSKYQTMFPRPLFKDFVTISHDNGLLCGASVFDEEAISVVKDGGGDFLKLATREQDNHKLNDACRGVLPLFISTSFSRDTRWRFSNNTQRVVMACTPKYPAIEPPIPSIHLGQEWGFSSHTSDWLDVLLAVSRGACVIEKHFALSDADYERGWSLDSAQFTSMVSDIRRVERMR